MGQLAVPIMIGAAMGGGTKLIQGKGLSGILKGAALGGALGGVGGTLGGATMQGAAGASAASGTSAVGAAQGAGQTAGVGLADTGAGMAFNPTSSLMSGAPGVNLTSQALSQGVQLPAGVGDALVANNIGAPSYLSQFGQAAKDYATPQNLLGVGQLLSQPSPQPTFASGGSGKIEVGEAPTGAIYDELRKLGYPTQKRRETNFSLLG